MPIASTIQPTNEVKIIQAQIPNAQPTIVVDTSNQAMEAQGIRSIKQEMMQPKSILKKPNSTSRFNRSRNNSSESLSINKLDSEISEASTIPSSAKINIVKEE
jgi:hypothetical protein